MPQGWLSFDEVGSGQLQDQDCPGPEIPRLRKGKAPSSPSAKNHLKSYPAPPKKKKNKILPKMEWEWGLDAPEPPEMEGRSP